MSTTPAMPPRPGPTLRRLLLLSAAVATGLLLPPPSSSAAAPAEPAPTRVITRGPKHHWFGYYDKLQFDPTDRYVLGMEVDFEHRSPTADDVVKVGMVDLEDGDRWIELGESRAWNWQQGCMLQWRPGSETEVLWNDREGDRFICRLLDVKTGRRRTIPHAIYSVSPDGKSAVTCDFRRLQDVRPGYGYAGLPDPHATERAPADTGIFHVDLETGEARLIIPVSTIVGIGPHADPDPAAKHYFNHLLFNPDGSRFVALHRCRLPDKTWRSRMITARPDGSDIHVVIPNGSVSHFIWRDPSHILAQSRNWVGETRWGNFLFEDVTGGGRVEQIGKDVLDPGGHLLYLPGNEWILNDTYPKTKRRLQTPHLYHVASGHRFDLGHFHLPPEYTGEWRVDTHPRLNRTATVVCIDAPHGDEGRQLQLIDIRGVLARGGGVDAAAAAGGTPESPAPESADLRPSWTRGDAIAAKPVWTEWRNSLAPVGQKVSLDLTADGGTDYTIVMPADPPAITRRAAAELALWLREVTGAEFPIRPDSEPPTPREISVGQTTRLAGVPSEALAAAGLESAAELPAEGYAVIVDGERLLLAGNGTTAPLHAVAALLEEDLGLRWYEPAADTGDWRKQTAALAATPWPTGTVQVPKQPTLTAGIVPRTVQPGFPIRTLGWERSYDPWGLRNRLNGGYAGQWGEHGYVNGSLYCHTFHTLVPPEKFFADHPEWYSLLDGKRQWKEGQLCLSNPEVAAAAAQTLAGIFLGVPEAQRPVRHLASVSVMDYEGDCECDPCRTRAAELGGTGGLVLDFVNRVAEQVTPEFPWVTLTTLAYRQSKPPPVTSLRAHPSVAVRFCTDFGASFNWPYHSLRDEQVAEVREQREWFDRWRMSSPRMHVWIYPHQYRHTLVPMPSLEPVAENLRFFRERGVESAYVQQSVAHDLGREPLRFWVFTKLLWDPSLDVDALVQDYVWGAYGKAAPAVIEYERFLVEQYAAHGDFDRRRNWIYPIHDESMLQHDFGPRAREILGRAAAAADTPEITRRVERLLAGVVYAESVQVFMAMRDSPEPPDRDRYRAVTAELADLCERLEIRNVDFHDGKKTIEQAADWLAALRREEQLRYGELPAIADACDAAAFSEDFAAAEPGGLPAGWQRTVQMIGGRPTGIAEATRHFVNQPALQLRDTQAHVAVWTEADDVLPAGSEWVMQLDFLLGGELVFQAAGLGEKQPAGALVGLKRGGKPGGEFLPLVQADNGGEVGGPIRLTAFGSVLAEAVEPHRWHRLAIEREGTTWRFFLDGELVQTVSGRDTDLRGIAFGSFADWQHVATDIFYARLRVGATRPPP